MKRLQWPLTCVGLSMLVIAFLWLPEVRAGLVSRSQKTSNIPPVQRNRPEIYREPFQIQVLVNGRPLEEYRVRNKIYVEAQRGAEYEVQIRNPLPVRVAVALSVDGLNSIDARRTSAWNASKWVIRPYETIVVGGWQMSSERARRFYFTTEEDSYAAKLGQTSNLGLISAVFFRERAPREVTIVRPPHPRSETGNLKREAPAAADESRVDKQGTVSRLPDDGYAATGIGRSVQHDVRWIQMELEPAAVAELGIRYEYYSALVRLGVLPRPPHHPEPLPRRERATGFSPEP